MFADRFSHYSEQQSLLLTVWTDLARDRAVVRIGGMLIALVIAFCVLHGVLYSRLPPDAQNSDLAMRLYGTFSIQSDGSIAEQFTYGMSFAAAILFLTAALTMRSRLCLLLAVFMALAWFDDSAMYHERVAHFFADQVSPPMRLGLDGVAQGELLAWFTIGLVLLPFAVSAWIGRQPADSIVLRLAAVPAVMLIISASVFDLLHALLHSSIGGLVYLEDGGEMISIALLATVALYLARNAGDIVARYRAGSFRSGHLGMSPRATR